MRQRLFLFAAAILTALGLIFWFGWIAWETTDQLADRLSNEQLESFQVGDTFSADLHELRSHFRRYEATRNENHWVQFDSNYSRMASWLEKKRLHAASAQEASVLVLLEKSLESYWDASYRVRSHIVSGASHETVAPDIGHLGDLAANMAQQLRQLLNVREQSLALGIGSARSRLSSLVLMLSCAMGALLILSSILAALVYRDMIQPLRREVLESRDLMARSEKLASLGVLAAGVAHEIRNPLTAIKARLFIQQRHLPAGNPAIQDSQIIHGEIHRLERIVRDVLDFARPAAPSLVALDTDTVLTEIRHLFEPQCEREQIRLLITSTEPVPVWADPSQLKQAIINLVRNAMEAVSKGGTIQLRALSGERRMNGVLRSVTIIQVEDDGPGIAPETRARLFDPFFTTKSGGTGLGLSIVARIIEKHGGALEVESRYSPEHALNPPIRSGSTFTIVIPMAE